MKNRKIAIGIFSAAILSVCAVLVGLSLFNGGNSNNVYKNFIDEAGRNQITESVPGLIITDTDAAQDQNTANVLQNSKAANSKTNSLQRNEAGKKEEKTSNVAFYGDLNSDYQPGPVVAGTNGSTDSQNATTIYYKWDGPTKTIHLSSTQQTGYTPFETDGTTPPWQQYNTQASTVEFDNEITVTNAKCFFSPVVGPGYGPYSSITNFVHLEYFNLKSAINVDFAFAGLAYAQPDYNTNLALDSAQSAYCMFQHSNFSTNFLTSIAGTITSNLKNTSYMFASCASLEGELTCPSLADGVNAKGMFANNHKLTKFTFPDNSTHKEAANYDVFLYGCGIKTVDATKWNPVDTNGFDVNYLFYNCNQLSEIDVATSWSKFKNVKGDKMYFGCTQLPNYDPKNTGIDSSDTYQKPVTEEVAYAELSSSSSDVQNDVLTFKYGKMPAPTDPVTAWDCTDTGNTAPGWTEYVGGIRYTRGTVTKVIFDDSFKNARPKSMNNWFAANQVSPSPESKRSTIETIEGLKEYVVTDAVTDMTSLFQCCDSLTTPPDVSDFNTANVKSLEAMFVLCSNLTKAPDVSKFDTSKVEKFDQMFYGCSSMTTTPDVSNFKTGLGTAFNTMFSGCSAMTETPDVSNWDTKNATVIYGMFSNCTGLTVAPDVSKWDVSKLTDAKSVFSGCIFKTIDLSSWKFSGQRDASANVNNMFSKCKELEHIYCTDDWTSNIIDNVVFNNCEKLDRYTIKGNGSINCKPVKEDGTGGYFEEKSTKSLKAVYDPDEDSENPMPSLTFYYDDKDHASNGVTVYTEDQLKPGEAKTSKANWPYKDYVTSIKKVTIDPTVADFKGFKSTAYMFQSFENVTDLDGFEYLDVSNVTDMTSMFEYFGHKSKTLSKVPNVRDWRTTNVKSLSNTFNYYAFSSEIIEDVPDVELWDVSNVENLYATFCAYAAKSTKLTDVPNVSLWDTSNVTDMGRTFIYYNEYNTQFNQVPNISDWQTGKVTSFSNMFFGYGNNSEVLDKVPDVSNFEISVNHDVNTEGMFRQYAIHSQKINTIPDFSKWDTGRIVNASGMFSSYAQYKLDDFTPVWDFSNFNTSNISIFNSMLRSNAIKTIKLGTNWTLPLDSVNSGCSLPEVVNDGWYNLDTKAGPLSCSQILADKGSGEATYVQINPKPVPAELNPLSISLSNSRTAWYIPCFNVKECPTDLTFYNYQYQPIAKSGGGGAEGEEPYYLPSDMKKARYYTGNSKFNTVRCFTETWNDSFGLGLERATKYVGNGAIDDVDVCQNLNDTFINTSSRPVLQFEDHNVDLYNFDKAVDLPYIYQIYNYSSPVPLDKDVAYEWTFASDIPYCYDWCDRTYYGNDCVVFSRSFNNQPTPPTHTYNLSVDGEGGEWLGEDGNPVTSFETTDSTAPAANQSITFTGKDGAPHTVTATPNGGYLFSSCSFANNTYTASFKEGHPVNYAVCIWNIEQNNDGTDTITFGPATGASYGSAITNAVRIEDDWSTIKQACNDGTAHDKYSTALQEGHVKIITLTLNDTLYSGASYSTPGSCIFYSINSEYLKWNKSITGSASGNPATQYSSSRIRATLNGYDNEWDPFTPDPTYAGDNCLSQNNSLLSCFPNDVKTTLKVRSYSVPTSWKNTNPYDIDGSVNIKDVLWPANTNEVYGPDKAGIQYADYEDIVQKYNNSAVTNSSRIAYNENGVAQNWWLRSPYRDQNGRSAARVTNTGSRNYFGVNNQTCGLAPCFCL